MTPELGTKLVKSSFDRLGSDEGKVQEKDDEESSSIVSEIKDSGAFKVVASTPSQSEEKKSSLLKRNLRLLIRRPRSEKQLKEMMNKDSVNTHLRCGTLHLRC